MNMRTLAKKAIKEQIGQTAFTLFKKNGYDKTTVGMIADAMGMSARTYFRYYSSKEDVLLEPTFAFRERFIEGLKLKLRSEDIWDVLENLLADNALNCTAQKDNEFQNLIRETPTLFARQLQVFEEMLAEASDLYISQEDKKLSRHTVNALIRSAFSCLQAVQSLTHGETSREEFSNLMADMKPAFLEGVDKIN